MMILDSGLLFWASLYILYRVSHFYVLFSFVSTSKLCPKPLLTLVIHYCTLFYCIQHTLNHSFIIIILLLLLNYMT